MLNKIKNNKKLKLFNLAIIVALILIISLIYLAYFFKTENNQSQNQQINNTKNNQNLNLSSHSTDLMVENNREINGKEWPEDRKFSNFFKEGDVVYKKDSKRNELGEKVYYAVALKEIDADSFVKINHTLFKDKNGIYYYNHDYSYDHFKLDGIDPETFEELSDINFQADSYFLKDKNGFYVFARKDPVYNRMGTDILLKKLEVDKDSFVFFNSSYAQDKNNIYYIGHGLEYDYDLIIFKSVDKNTFTYLYKGYAKDKNNVYYKTNNYVEPKIIEEADAKTFEIVDGEGKDKNNIYENGEIKIVFDKDIDDVKWKTFENKKFGLKLKYPEDLTISGPGKNNNSMFIKSPSRTSFDIFRFSTLKTNLKDAAEEELKTWNMPTSFDEFTETTIDKEPAVFLNTSLGNTVYIVLKDDHYYRINLLDENYGYKEANEFMLNSIEFVEHNRWSMLKLRIRKFFYLKLYELFEWLDIDIDLEDSFFNEANFF